MPRAHAARAYWRAPIFCDLDWVILMRGSYTVALVGFSQQEASTLESFLRLAARRPPGYVVQDEVMDAQILIVNADNPQALHLVRHAELPGRVLLIGSADGGTGWPLQRKPVKLVAVLDELDRLVGIKAPLAPEPALAAGPSATAPPFRRRALPRHRPWRQRQARGVVRAIPSSRRPGPCAGPMRCRHLPPLRRPSQRPCPRCDACRQRHPSALA